MKSATQRYAGAWTVVEGEAVVEWPGRFFKKKNPNKNKPVDETQEIVDPGLNFTLIQNELHQ